jgi:hypothetical protein
MSQIDLHKLGVAYKDITPLALEKSMQNNNNNGEFDLTNFNF